MPLFFSSGSTPFALLRGRQKNLTYALSHPLRKDFLVDAGVNPTTISLYEGGLMRPHISWQAGSAAGPIPCFAGTGAQPYERYFLFAHQSTRALFAAGVNPSRTEGVCSLRKRIELPESSVVGRIPYLNLTDYTRRLPHRCALCNDERPTYVMSGSKAEPCLRTTEKTLL